MCYKFVVILFILILSTQKVFLTAAESDYAENIQLWLDIYPLMSCNVSVIFSFSGLSRPLNFIDFQSEPSFLGFDINARYFTGGGSISVTIVLNESKVSTNRGSFIADMMTYELESDFEIPSLIYGTPAYYSPTQGVINYNYESNFSAIELKDIFLESLPSQGFKQILASMLSNNHNFSMWIGLGNEGGWSLRLSFSEGTRKLVPDQEQIISLKEITGYSGSIASAPASSSSTLRLDISNQISRDYELVVNSVSPTQMRQGQQEGTPQYWFSYDDTGSSVEDFSISLKVVSSGIVAAVLIVLAQITTLLISIIIIKRHKS